METNRRGPNYGKFSRLIVEVISILRPYIENLGIEKVARLIEISPARLQYYIKSAKTANPKIIFKLLRLFKDDPIFNTLMANKDIKDLYDAYLRFPKFFSDKDFDIMRSICEDDDKYASSSDEDSASIAVSIPLSQNKVKAKKADRNAHL